MDTLFPPRLFSLREAQLLVPTLRAQFERARAFRDQLVSVQEELTGFGHGIDGPDVQVDAHAPPAVQRLQARASEIISAIRGILEEATQLGVEVKAADGLVDFRSRHDGRVVLLCWKYPEERITHFHELEGGFAGRKPLPEGGAFTGDLLH